MRPSKTKCNETIRKLVVFLAKDVGSAQPTVTNTIFSGEEICNAAGIYATPVEIEEIMDFMVNVHYFFRTNKICPQGYYYNVTPHVYLLIHPSVRTKRFVNKQVEPLEGWCITYTENRIFRMSCKAKKCKFYFDSEKKCLHNKMFF
jgi:hypothetical protein